MNKLLSIFLSLFFSTASYAVFSYPVLVLDADNTDTLPERFRTTHSPLPTNNKISTQGLNKLLLAGSGQFSEKQLGYAINYLHPTSLMIFDLRQESHGFINGDAISWYDINDQANKNKTAQQVEQDQFQRLNALQSMKSVSIQKILQKTTDGQLMSTTTLTLKPTSVFAEADLARAFNLGYTRIYVTDHEKPVVAQVERFIGAVQALPANTWIYFHCREGKGRTTTFMAMLDMMRNAKTVSLDDILGRQALLGGIDLTTPPAINDINYQAATERLAFLHNFYDYANTNSDNFKTSFSSWEKQQTLEKLHDNKTITPSTTPTTPTPATTTTSITTTPPAAVTTTPMTPPTATSTTITTSTPTPTTTPTLTTNTSTTTSSSTPVTTPATFEE